MAPQTRGSTDPPGRTAQASRGHGVPFPTGEERPLAGALPNRRATPSSLVRAPVNGRFVDPDKVIPGEPPAGAKGIAVLPLFPIFRQFFHFHENPSSSVISGTFSRKNRFPQKRQKLPKIAKHTKHEPLPKRDAIFATFP